MTIEITSNAFEHEGFIPANYTCDGQNISPELKWDNFPLKTMSFVLICEDPDAVGGNFVHWVVYNIPSEMNSLEENFPDDETLPNGVRQGITSFGSTGYGGPCPPSGVHRYYFRIYALDNFIDIVMLGDYEKVQEMMQDHILDKGELMGKYQRKNR